MCDWHFISVEVVSEAKGKTPDSLVSSTHNQQEGMESPKKNKKWQKRGLEALGDQDHKAVKFLLFFIGLRYKL